MRQSPRSAWSNATQLLSTSQQGRGDGESEDTVKGATRLHHRPFFCLRTSTLTPYSLAKGGSLCTCQRAISLRSVCPRGTRGRPIRVVYPHGTWSCTALVELLCGMPCSVLRYVYKNVSQNNSVRRKGKVADAWCLQGFVRILGSRTSRPACFLTHEGHEKGLLGPRGHER